MTIKGVPITVVIYVDDLLLVCTDVQVIHMVIGALKKRYGEIKTAEGLIHNYLGLVIDFTEAPIVTLNQTGMIEDIITSTMIAVDTARSDGSKVNLKVGPRITPKTPPQDTCLISPRGRSHFVTPLRLSFTRWSQS